MQYFEAVVAEKKIPETTEFCVESIGVSGLPKQQLSSLLVVISAHSSNTNAMQRVHTARFSEGVCQTSFSAPYSNTTF